MRTKLEDACLEFPEYTYLLSIPGFGPDVSAKVLGAIGDPHRFTSGKAGVEVGGSRPVRETKWKDVKQGNADHLQDRARRICGVRYTRQRSSPRIKSKDFIPYFTNKLIGRAKEKGIGTKMRVKLAAKLLIIAWTLMKKKEVFDPAYLNMEDQDCRE